MFTNNLESFLGYFWPETILVVGILVVLGWEILYRPAPRAHVAAITAAFLAASATEDGMVSLRRDTH
jgi:hypothetical protein